MGSRSGDETVTLEVEIEATTTKAYLIYDTETGRKEWVPKSQVVELSAADRDGVSVMVITEWIAKKNGFI